MKKFKKLLSGPFPCTISESEMNEITKEISDWIDGEILKELIKLGKE